MAASRPVFHTQRASQQGIALIVVLIMLGAIFLLTAFGARLTLSSEKAARNDRDRQIAFQAAEAALGDAEIDIMGPNTASNSREALLDSRNLQLFAQDCGATAESRGLCHTNTATTAPFYKSVNFEDTSASRRYVSLGEYTGRGSGFSTGDSALPAKLPRYIAETIAYNIPGGCPNQKAFLVTALGYGLNPQTQVMLQSVIFKPSAILKC